MKVWIVSVSWDDDHVALVFATEELAIAAIGEQVQRQALRQTTRIREMRKSAIRLHEHWLAHLMGNADRPGEYPWEALRWQVKDPRHHEALVGTLQRRIEDLRATPLLPVLPGDLQDSYEIHEFEVLDHLPTEWPTEMDW